MKVNVYDVDEDEVIPATAGELLKALFEAWNAGAWDDDRGLLVEVAETDAVLTSASVDSDGKPIAPCACAKCGYDGFADVDSVTPFCPICGRKMRRVHVETSKGLLRAQAKQRRVPAR